MGSSAFWVGRVVVRTGFSLPTVDTSVFKFGSSASGRAPETSASRADALVSSEIEAIASATGALTDEGTCEICGGAGLVNPSGSWDASATSGLIGSGAERITSVVGSSGLSAGAPLFISFVAEIVAPSVGVSFSSLGVDVSMAEPSTATPFRIPGQSPAP